MLLHGFSIEIRFIRRFFTFNQRLGIVERFMVLGFIR